ncbi:DUF1289 domain-containing protein [Shewanella xiamenensis]|uniref:DUF1289 domain-containing protein n=1 Tax=Shewanella xiamenensis TaxID=332186 RepID=UPI001C4F3525|nr:DUF1289 domain-containing protein [Shewanella xiamenensis]MBW0281871.1 DUF1289 domain-containing protein [Shewanella xiamenensis]MCT8873308.1 DUF1289 domain-containing protein [Shewanella xiamenensis]UWH43750.1 DUF1289 domain-containing protein [Shewanella xiamenensis]
MNMRSGQNNSIYQPCVRNCCLDQQDICMGCFRHLKEILAWRNMTEAQRSACYLKMAERKAIFMAKRPSS